MYRKYRERRRGVVITTAEYRPRRRFTSASIRADRCSAYRRIGDLHSSCKARADNKDH